MDGAIIRALRDAGIDVLTAQEAGMRGRSDPDQLDFAATAGRALITSNARDFHNLHVRVVSSGGHHNGIVIVERGRYRIGERVRRLAFLARVAEPDDLVDTIEHLSDWGEV